MEIELGLTKAREKLSDLVDRVQYNGDTYVISRHGKPAAAVVPMEVYESWRRQREELFDTIRLMQEETDLTPSKAAKVASEALSEVRSGSSK